MRFEELQLIGPLLRAVKAQGYTEATPIQAQAIPHILAGRDLVGLAQTGTGKTAAFSLPLLQRLSEINGERKSRRHVQALVLAPTRELASQIGDSIKAYAQYTRLNHVVIYGGVSQKRQVERVRRGVNIIVATPGRLLDLMDQGHIRLGRLDILVLDEADRMFDMGFLPDIKRIISKLPTERQTLLFSATMPPDIQALTRSIQQDPIEVSVAPESTTVEAIEQQVYFVEKSDKRQLLEHLLDEHNMHRTLVFTRTKHRANTLSKKLSKGRLRAEAIHGDRSQRQRQVALENFKRGKTQVLVATDIVARGIDVDHISHVVNFDLPNETESYVHRIGRTGRAGSDGIAVSFCAVDERAYLESIERLIQMHIPVVETHPYASSHGTPRPTDLNGRRRSGNSNGKFNGKGRSDNRKRRSNNRSHNSNGNGNREGQNNGNNKRRRRPRRKPVAE